MTIDHCRDFDFQQGRWRVKHRRLKFRLAGCTEWEEFEGTSEQRPVLGGNGNIEDNLLHLPGGDYRAVALRSFDAASGTWAIWWLDSRAPHAIDVPVIGSFEEGVGSFYADDVHDGRPVRLRFRWLGADRGAPRWEQALSDDGGATWETNWVMEFSRA
ncbi:DUF1579 domain-containing protein [Allosphingosinicella indica]|uniref:DUF1579 domain-containing protein n=1 Tax=Allosphingosinicella indica TaxID=941907 RepID=A0A1X7G8F6_9SPHN|nr:DUF1579 domain-containing protein [Allosphingosinicella indica]SMF65770.1 hypothetical protein SAMN06295910_1333 [Allosphingosinicella indica]